MSRVTAVITGCLISLIVLVARHGIDIVGLFWMVVLLAAVFVVVTLGRPVFDEHKSWLMPLWVRLQSHIPTFPMPKLIWKKRRGADWEEQMTTLHSAIADLGEELKALSSYVSHNRCTTVNQHQQDLPCLSTEPHQAYWREFRALLKSLSHLGTPANDARLELEDLDFYEEWVRDLTQRFRVFLQQYIQQQETINRALSNAETFQEEFVTSWQPSNRYSDYWGAYGSYCALEELLKEGAQPASLLPAMVKAQSKILAFRDKGLLSL